MPVSLDRLGVRTVYASRRGARLDSNLDTGGGTDDAALLQALLDLAQFGPLHLVIDGVALVGTPLDVWSNTKIDFPDGCGLYAKPGLNGPVIRNRHWVSSYNGGGTPVYDGSTIVDHDITILGGRIEGNRGDGTSGNCTGGDPRLAGASKNGIAANQYVSAVMFFGVRGLTIRDLAVTNSPSYLMWLANAFDVRLDNLTLSDPGHLQYSPHRNTDGLHLNGPVDNLVATGLRIEAGDDGIALNADDGNLDGSTDPGSGQAAFKDFATVYKGPITRVVVDGVRSVGMSVLRILSGTSPIDAVKVCNVWGSCYYHAVIGNLFGAIPGTGNVGRVSLENWDVDQTSNADGFMVFGGKYAVLSLRNINRVHSAGAGGWPLVLGGSSPSNYGIVEIDGLHVHEPVDRQAGPVVDASYASIGSLSIRNSSWRRPGLGTSAHPFLAAANASIAALLLANVDAERCTNLVRHSGATLADLRVVGCSYRNGDPAGIATAGTIANLSQAGNLGLAAPSGTISNSGVNL